MLGIKIQDITTTFKIFTDTRDMNMISTYGACEAYLGAQLRKLEIEGIFVTHQRRGVFFACFLFPPGGLRENSSRKPFEPSPVKFRFPCLKVNSIKFKL